MPEFTGKAKPGEVRNPSGSNGHTPISSALKAIISRPAHEPIDDEPATWGQAIALEWAKKARAGELAAITSMTDRVEGKSTDNVNLKHSGSVAHPTESVSESLEWLEGAAGADTDSAPSEPGKD